MKMDEADITIEELDKLCSLYMECSLSLLEEKELEYVLSHTGLTSPAIEEVRALMSIRAPRHAAKPASRPRRRIIPYICTAAACGAILLSAGLYFLSAPRTELPGNESAGYVAVYSGGQRLTGDEALSAAGLCIAKADSLMNYAALLEHESLAKANMIISETINN